MEKLLLLPPIAFLIVLLFWLLQLKGLSIFSMGLKKPEAAGAGRPYACGEDVKENRVQPDYRQFFPFAFFFTIMHVVALVVATCPALSKDAAALAAFYVMAAAVGLVIMFRR